jgi:hypothetical protein
VWLAPCLPVCAPRYAVLDRESHAGAGAGAPESYLGAECRDDDGDGTGAH